MRAFLFGTLVALLLGARGAPNRQVTVQLINGKTGQPYILRGRSLQLDAYDSMGSLTNRSPRLLASIRANQDAEGKVRFVLTEPAPPVVCVFVPRNFNMPCFDRECFWTHSVLQRGLVTDDNCDRKGKLKGRFTPKPSEMILFVRRRTVRDTL